MAHIRQVQTSKNNGDNPLACRHRYSALSRFLLEAFQHSGQAGSGKVGTDAQTVVTLQTKPVK